jgi:hypothetical protein
MHGSVDCASKVTGSSPASQTKLLNCVVPSCGYVNTFLFKLHFSSQFTGPIFNVAPICKIVCKIFASKEICKQRNKKSDLEIFYFYIVVCVFF